jgi:hypothetical protein
MELENIIISEIQDAKYKPSSVIGHVTIEHTKKQLKIQQIISVLAVAIGLGLAIIGNQQQSSIGLIICGLSCVWLLVAIPLQKWWHHG